MTFFKIDQIREVGVTETGITSALGRPYGSSERVEVADLLWTAACKAPQQQQQQQQQQQTSAKCNCESRGEDNQSKFDYEGTTYGLVGLLIAEFGLGAILMAFPQTRTCIYTVLVWARAIKIANPTPESNAPQAVVEAAVVAPPVRGNCQFLITSG